MKLIGTAFIYNHDIHYGYEGGFDVNFTITGKGLTEDRAIAFMLKKFNKKSITQLKSEWKDYLAEDEFSFGEESEYATRKLIFDIDKDTIKYA